MTLSESTSCLVCGHQPWSSDRYCSACGSPLTAATQTVRAADGRHDDDEPDETVELEALATGRATPSSGAEASPLAPKTGWRWLRTLAVVVVIALAGWRLISAFPANDEAAATAQSATQSAAQPEPERSAATSTADPRPEPTSQAGFWPEARDVREGLLPTGGLVDEFVDDVPPERRAALQALYGSVPITDLDLGRGSLAVDITGGPVLIDLVSGDVLALAGRNQLLPVGATELGAPGIVMRFADPVLFGGANEAAGVVLPWDGGSPIGLAAVGWQTADRAGNYLLSFSGDRSQADYVVTDLATGRTAVTGIPVDGPPARVTSSGRIVLAVAGGAVEATPDFGNPDPEAPEAPEAVSFRSVGYGEVLDAIGGFVVRTCDEYPSCQLHLYDDRFERQGSQRLDGVDLPFVPVGPLIVAPDGSGFAGWSSSGAGSLQLVVTGGTDDRALPDLPVVFSNLFDGEVLPDGLIVEWAPSGSGLFLLDPRDRELRFLSLVSGRVVPLDLPSASSFIVVAAD